MAALSGEGKIGWGGRIRTFTVLINSEVSYQLDHAPAGFAWLLRGGPEPAGLACKVKNNTKRITWRGASAREENEASGPVLRGNTTMTSEFELFRNVQIGCPLR